VYLNPIKCQERIQQWLAYNFQENSIVLEFDENSSAAAGSDTLHFEAFVEVADDEQHVAPTPTRDAFNALRRDLGPAFYCMRSADKLDIYVTQPSASDAMALLRRFKWRTLQLARPVWPLYIAILLTLLAFGGVCYFASALHDHWHQYESPWETLFHYIFSLFIYVGGQMRASVVATTENVVPTK